MYAILLAATFGCSSGTQTASTTATQESSSQDSTDAQGPAVGDDATVEAVMAQNAAYHEAAELDSGAGSEVSVELTGDSATASGDGVSVDGSTVKITAAGTYRISGTLTDGSIVVDTPDDGLVRLVLDGAHVHNESGSALSILEAGEVAVVLADGSENTLSDTDAYTLASDTDEPNATLFSTADLTIDGGGSLKVVAKYNDAIASKDGLVIQGGSITAEAVDDGIRGKDFLVVEGGSLTVDAGGDGLKSDNDTDTTMGYVALLGGTVDITSGGDGIDAATDIVVADSEVAITSGGGATSRVSGDASAKGIKGPVVVVVDSGSIEADSADDALHSNDTIVINDGELSLSSADDGAHADTALTIHGGSIKVARSYEGLESSALTITGGDIEIHSSDDGVNAAGGNDGSGQQRPGGPPDAFSAGDHSLAISGGTLRIDADGDGLDINGSITMSGGEVVVDGPTEQMNGPLDYDGTFDISGGTLVATGSAGMAMAPTADSAQLSLLAVFDAAPSGSTVVVRTTGGDEVIKATPTKSFESIAVSTPEISAEEEYEIVVDGEVVATTTTDDAASVRGFGGPPPPRR